YFGPDHDAGQDQVAWGNWSANGETYSPQTPMLNDIMTIQRIYGANTSTRSANTVYGFNSNITGTLAEIYDFTQNAHPILCLYDAGGTDTLDLSGWNTNSRIDLNAGAFSDCNGMTSNLSIAYNCVIENLTTGSGQDTLTGNAVANVFVAGSGTDLLQGNGGNDLLDGGSGTDTAVFTYNLNNYRISYNGSAFQIEDQTSARDGTDTLQQIEQLRFADQTTSIHYAAATPGQTTRLISDSYLAYQVSAHNGDAVLTDLNVNRNGVTLYTDIERLQFTDITVGLDVGAGQHTGEVYRLYLTVLGRNPETDPVGCGFWIDKLDRNILNTEQMVGYFLDSTEFVTRFGGTTNANDAFVNLMYLNLLGRDGHPDSGFSFWLNVLNNHQASREQVVVGFMESPENITNAAPLIGDAPTFQQWLG
uniref:M10 family metallopeptidase C-terminal domain-containing protein n=1 Tax=Flavobacterium sp. TaxID=239 RepID=UPI0037C0C8FE